MEAWEPRTQLQAKVKLPISADWWREVDYDQEKLNNSQTESTESPSPNSSAIDNQKIVTERNNTLLSAGDIEISNILFPVLSESERQVYERNCEKFQCPSSRKFGKTLDNLSMDSKNDNVNMAHYGLTSMGVRATAISISNLSHCSVIDLQGNRFNADSLTTFIQLIQKCPATEINLSSTNISKFGPTILSKWISSSMIIKTLFLTNNKFDDEDGIVLFEALASNRSLIHVDLSDNGFCIRCGDSLKKLLDENDVLEVFDLSWNNLRLNATQSIAKGLRKNNGLKTLSLNWNGVEDTCAKEMGLALMENDCLQQLELICNRITDSGFNMFMKGLEKNVTLKSVRVGRNHISQEAAEKILASLKNGDLQNSGIDTLDFTGNIFKQSFQSAIDSVKETRDEFICSFGYDDSYGKRRMVSYNPVWEALQFLKSYLKNNDINFVELFDKFDLNGSMSVSYDEFRQGLKEASIPISDEQVNRLIEYLDADHDGEIDFSELVFGAEKHSDKATS